MSSAAESDVLFVGAGLANGLIAWRLADRRPDLRLRLLEAGAQPGGNHTWSFHESDLTPEQARWVLPFVGHRWAGHQVRFPLKRRGMAGGYASITSEGFAKCLRGRFGDRLVCNANALAVDAGSARLADGRDFRAACVLDARGAVDSPHLALGFQKFLGQELRTARPHRLDRPVLMDATVDQLGGYRFMYVLPLAPDRLLIEDTCYADGAELDDAALRRRIAAYARTCGWSIAECLREERGVLPIVLAGKIKAHWRDAARGAVPVGLAAALFHPTTGYSLPDAVEVADLIAGLPRHDDKTVRSAVRAHVLARWRERGFFRLLNRMLFRAAVPSERWRVMQRFYGLDEGLIARFYAGRPSLLDKLRIVSGKPPVPLGAALRAALDTRPPVAGPWQEDPA